MKTILFTLSIAVMLCSSMSSKAQEAVSSTNAVTEARSESGNAELGEIRSSLIAINAALTQLIKDMDNRTEAADRRLKAIEQTLGTENMSRFGGISRQLDDLQRDIDDIERKVDDIERNQR